jgi:hypothetical protein
MRGGGKKSSDPYYASFPGIVCKLISFHFECPRNNERGGRRRKFPAKRKRGMRASERKYCKITQNGDWKTLHIRS